MNRVLIIAAHPDDDILGCAGLLSKNRNTGKEFRVIFIAEGTSCRFSSEVINSIEVKDEILKRNNFGIDALKFLGVNDYRFFDLPCGRLDTIPIIEINKIIESEITEFQPDTIFTHSEHDTNNDHRIVNRSTMMATRPIPGRLVDKIFSYEILSSSEWNFGSKFFEPNYFVELSEQNVIEKAKALNFYKTEIKNYPYPRSEEGIKTICKQRGMQVGVNYAEAFKLLKSIER
jgi:LmbE family N-acetylglucosaminyl deacetylase